MTSNIVMLLQHLIRETIKSLVNAMNLFDPRIPPGLSISVYHQLNLERP